MSQVRTDSGNTDARINDMTMAMEVIQMEDDTNDGVRDPAGSPTQQQQQRPVALVTPNPNRHRPYDTIKAAGPPAKPIDFERARFERGRRADVLVYIEQTGQHQQANNVLFRDFSREFGDMDGGLSRVKQAYWPLPNKEKIRTIMGHVEICIVLTRCVSSQSDNDDSSSSSDSDCGGEEDEDIVFQLTDRYVAVKVNYSSKMEELRGRHAEDPLKEIAAMQLIGNSHPNVMGVLEVLFDGNNLNVVMPYCGSGDLFQLLNDAQSQGRGFSEPTARYWFKQILSGMQYLQSKGICHRDLSPENVMMDNDGCLIIDMGMAIRIPYSDTSGNVTSIQQGNANGQQIRKRLVQPQGACGKLPYMSPEVYRSHEPFDGTAVDIWTAGTILFCMVTGNRSYQRPHDSDPQYYWMTKGLRRLVQDWNVQLSEECLHLLENMIQIDQRLRLTLEEVINHPWFTSFPDAPPPSSQQGRF